AARAARRRQPVQARRLHLRARADGIERRRLRDPPARGLPRRRCLVNGPLTPRRMVELEIARQARPVFGGQTILDACRKVGIDTPTLCYGETLRPKNACRVC